MDRSPSLPRKAEAIFTATVDLVADHGFDALSMEAIAERAGVNKTTLYRTWASKDELLAAALVHTPTLAFEIRDTGSFRGDLIGLAAEIHRLLVDPATLHIVGALVAAVPDRPATGRAALEFFADRLAREQVIVRRAVDRGEVTSDLDFAMLIDLIAGNLWFRILIRRKPVDSGYLDSLVDTILHGALPQLGPDADHKGRRSTR